MAPPADASRPAFDPQTGTPVEVAAGIVRVTAPNASAFTFTGTNTFLIGTNRLLVLDPGPKDQRHLEALRKAMAGRPVEAILLTHTHRDHSDLARDLNRQALHGKTLDWLDARNAVRVGLPESFFAETIGRDYTHACHNHPAVTHTLHLLLPLP